MNASLFLLPALLLSSPLSPHPAQAADCGGISCGGGSTINGVTLDTYLAEHKAKPEDLERLRGMISPQMKELASKLPEFAAELDSGFQQLDWYQVDVPLDQLPFSRTKTPFLAPHAAIQIEDRVFLSQGPFAELAKKEGEQSKLVLHELVRRIFLAAEGTNFQVSEGSVFEATELLTNASRYSAEELRAKLEALGFQTRNIAYANVRDKARGRKIEAMSDPVVVSVDLRGSVTVARAREIVQYCLHGGGNFREPSFFRDFAEGISGPLESFQIPQKTIVAGFGGSGYGITNPPYGDSEPEPALYPQFGGFSMQARSTNDQDRRAIDITAGLANGVLRYGQSHDVGTENTPGFRNPKVTKLDVIPEGGFPAVEFQGDKTEPVYTPFGLTNTDRKIDRISIVANRNWVEGDGLVNFRNAVNGVTLPVKANGKRYVDCLKSNFERASRADAMPLEQPPAVVIESDVAPKGAPVMQVKEAETTLVDEKPPAPAAAEPSEQEPKPEVEKAH